MLFSKFITKIGSTTIDDAKDSDLVMPIYNLIEYSSNYSETTGSFWLYSKDEANNFNADIANYENFKSFKYKAKLLGNRVAQPSPNAANDVLKNSTIAVPLKYLSKFWSSRETPLTNCKIELKLKWIKYCVLLIGGNDNLNYIDSDRIVFTIKDTKLYVLVVTLSARDNPKLTKLLSEGFERSIHWNEYKTKSDNENTTNESRRFLESNFIGVNRLFVLVYTNRDADSKRFNAKRYYLPKGIISK